MSILATTTVLAVDTAIHSGTGAFLAESLELKPINGAIFGALYFAGSYAVNRLEKALCKRDVEVLARPPNLFTTIFKFVLAAATGIFAAQLGCDFLAVDLSNAEFKLLSSVMVGTTIAIATLVSCRRASENVVVGHELVTAFSR